MFGVSKSVIPSSSAASITACVCCRSIRPPKLFVPSPTTVTSGPPSPSVRVRMPRRYRSDRGPCGSGDAQTSASERERTQVQPGGDEQKGAVADEKRCVLEDSAEHRAEQVRAERDRRRAHVLEPLREKQVRAEDRCEGQRYRGRQSQSPRDAQQRALRHAPPHC